MENETRIPVDGEGRRTRLLDWLCEPARLPYVGFNRVPTRKIIERTISRHRAAGDDAARELFLCELQLTAQRFALSRVAALSGLPHTADFAGVWRGTDPAFDRPTAHLDEVWDILDIEAYALDIRDAARAARAAESAVREASADVRRLRQIERLLDSPEVTNRRSFKELALRDHTSEKGLKDPGGADWKWAERLGRGTWDWKGGHKPERYSGLEGFRALVSDLLAELAQV